MRRMRPQPTRQKGAWQVGFLAGERAVAQETRDAEIV
jgi:hypothetical protein